jgi:hypothetical protein
MSLYIMRSFCLLFSNISLRSWINFSFLSSRSSYK